MSFMRKRPDKEKDRAAWNKSWEEDFDRFYSNPTSVFETMAPIQLENLRDVANMTQMQMVSRIKELCTLQRDLRDVAVKQFAYSDLENVWRAYAQERREELILEGLYVASCAGTLEDERRWCPEMRIKTLAGSDVNWDFINVMKKFLAVDEVTSDVVEPIMVSSEKFEARIRVPPHLKHDEAVNKTVRFYRLGRSYFMTLTIWSILNASRGIREAAINFKPPEAKEWRSPDARKLTQRILALSSPASTQAILDTQKPPDATRICYNCRLANSEALVKSGEELKVCKSCKAVGRSIWYCSRECQKADWSRGFPVPHKKFCGKPSAEDWTLPDLNSLTLGTATQSAVEKDKDGEAEGEAEGEPDVLGIPKPAASFKRPPALLYQIKLLTSQVPRRSNYFLVTPHPEPDYGIKFPDAKQRFAFAIYQRKALQTGDKNAVEGMYRILHPFAVMAKFPRLKTQLEQEYGVTSNTEPPERARDFQEPWDEVTRLGDEMMKENPTAMLPLFAAGMQACGWM